MEDPAFRVLEAGVDVSDEIDIKVPGKCSVCLDMKPKPGPYSSRMDLFRLRLQKLREARHELGLHYGPAGPGRQSGNSSPSVSRSINRPNFSPLISKFN